MSLEYIYAKNLKGKIRSDRLSSASMYHLQIFNRSRPRQSRGFGIDLKTSFGSKLFIQKNLTDQDEYMDRPLQYNNQSFSQNKNKTQQQQENELSLSHQKSFTKLNYEDNIFSNINQESQNLKKSNQEQQIKQCNEQNTYMKKKASSEQLPLTECLRNSPQIFQESNNHIEENQSNVKKFINNQDNSKDFGLIHESQHMMQQNHNQFTFKKLNFEENYEQSNFIDTEQEQMYLKKFQIIQNKLRMIENPQIFLTNFNNKYQTQIHKYDQVKKQIQEQYNDIKIELQQYVKIQFQINKITHDLEQSNQQKLELIGHKINQFQQLQQNTEQAKQLLQNNDVFGILNFQMESLNIPSDQEIQTLNLNQENQIQSQITDSFYQIKKQLNKYNFEINQQVQINKYIQPKITIDQRENNKNPQIYQKDDFDVNNVMSQNFKRKYQQENIQKNSSLKIFQEKTDLNKHLNELQKIKICFYLIDIVQIHQKVFTNPKNQLNNKK